MGRPPLNRFKGNRFPYCDTHLKSGVCTLNNAYIILLFCHFVICICRILNYFSQCKSIKSNACTKWQFSSLHSNGCLLVRFVPSIRQMVSIVRCEHERESCVRLEVWERDGPYDCCARMLEPLRETEIQVWSLQYFRESIFGMLEGWRAFSSRQWRAQVYSPYTICAKIWKIISITRHTHYFVDNFRLLAFLIVHNYFLWLSFVIGWVLSPIVPLAVGFDSLYYFAVPE